MIKVFLQITLSIAVTVASFLMYYHVSSNASQWELATEIDLSNEKNPVREMDYSIQEVINKNENIASYLDELRRTLFFKIVKINLDAECTKFKQAMICRSKECAVCQCEDTEIPLPWKQKLDKRETVNTRIDDPFLKWTEIYNVSVKQWLVESEIDSENGTYVNLLKNPEGYSGYQGPQIWNAIFNENCFAHKLTEICKEEKVFYRIFSGWLSNTNMQIGINYYNKETNSSYLNVSLITERFLKHQERVDNLFFLYSLLIKAFYKAEPLLKKYDYFTGNELEDRNTKSIIENIFKGKELEFLNEAFNETSLDFENFMHFKKINILITRFRNISSIIDCVSCQKCRMHGKIEVFGIATMLKILFEEEDLSALNTDMLMNKIKRNELVSFVNLLAKISRAISYMKKVVFEIKESHFQYRLKIIGIICIYVIIFWILQFVFFKIGNNEKTQDEKKNK